MPLVTLLVVGAASLAFRLSFTVLTDAGRLPVAVRDRLDVIGPATFAALVAGSVAGAVGTPGFVPALAGLAAAAAAATRTKQLVVPIALAVGAATAATAVLGLA